MRKFGRKKDQRRALLKGLVVNLITHGRIKTTQARAKETRVLAERLVTSAKKGDLAGRRNLGKFLPLSAAKKLSREIAPRFKERAGGYVRIIKLGRRMSDSAEMVILEFVE